LTEAEREELWAEVRAEFPNDGVMQEVHFARTEGRSTPRLHSR
jgi:hypothetical protein